MPDPLRPTRITAKPLHRVLEQVEVGDASAALTQIRRQRRPDQGFPAEQLPAQRWYDWMLPPPRFAPQAEADYLTLWRLPQALRLQRVTGWLAGLMYLAALTADQWLGTRMPYPWLFWGFALISLAMTSLLALGTYLPRLIPHAYSVAYFTLLVNGSLLIAVIAITRSLGNPFPAAWMLELLVYTFLLTGLPYRRCVPLGLGLGLANIGVSLWLKMPAPELADHIVFDCSVIVTSLIACSTMERSDRLNWLRSRLIQEQSNTDELTGLRNRRFLFEDGTQKILQASGKDLPIAVLMVDVDHFKKLNDSLGHPAGDQGLRELAKVLQAAVRHPLDIAARLGGEEFALLLFACGQAGAKQAADGLRAAVAAMGLDHPAAPLGHLTISVGVASSDAGCIADLESLLLAADKALYRAKAAGRNAVSL